MAEYSLRSKDIDVSNKSLGHKRNSSPSSPFIYTEENPKDRHIKEIMMANDKEDTTSQTHGHQPETQKKAITKCKNKQIRKLKSGALLTQKTFLKNDPRLEGKKGKRGRINDSNENDALNPNEKRFSKRKDKTSKKRATGVPEFTRRLWNEDEDKAMEVLIKKYGVKHWSLIGVKLEEEFKIQGRTGKQCRERWHHHLNPDVQKVPLSAEEEKAIFNGHKIHGNKWAEIAKMLNGRTDNMIKNYFYSTLRRQLRKISKKMRWRKKKDPSEITLAYLQQLMKDNNIPYSELDNENVRNFIEEMDSSPKKVEVEPVAEVPTHHKYELRRVKKRATPEESKPFDVHRDKDSKNEELALHSINSKLKQSQSALNKEIPQDGMIEIPQDKKVDAYSGEEAREKLHGKLNFPLTQEMKNEIIDLKDPENVCDKMPVDSIDDVTPYLGCENSTYLQQSFNEEELKERPEEKGNLDCRDNIVEFPKKPSPGFKKPKWLSLNMEMVAKPRAPLVFPIFTPLPEGDCKSMGFPISSPFTQSADIKNPGEYRRENIFSPVSFAEPSSKPQYREFHEPVNENGLSDSLNSPQL